MGHSQHVTSSTISLLLAHQIEDIIKGLDDQFKGKETNPDPAATPAAQQRPKPAKPPSIVPAMPNSSHLDAVPQATPINRNRVIHKKVRTFPLCFDDTDPPAVHENSAQPEVLVPIRLDMDIEGEQFLKNILMSFIPICEHTRSKAPGHIFVEQEREYVDTGAVRGGFVR